jgi:16S rRNA processing protein RimM
VSGRTILLGVIGRPHGVRGLMHVTSHTADPAALAAYGPLSDDSGRCFTLAWCGAGIAELSELRDGGPVRVSDRDAAARLTNTRLYIERTRLPQPDDDEFYLADLLGLEAVDSAGEPLGRVTQVHDYGAGVSLEFGRGDTSLIVPFTHAAVPEIDVAAGRLVIALPEETEAPGSLSPRHRGGTEHDTNGANEATSGAPP